MSKEIKERDLQLEFSVLITYHIKILEKAKQDLITFIKNIGHSWGIWVA